MKKRLYILCLALCITAALSAQGLTLDSCLALARQNNPSLRKSELGVKRAEEVKAQAFTKYFPQIQGTAFGFHALHPIIEVGIDDIGNAHVRDLLTTLYGNYGAALGLDNTINLFEHGYMVGVTAVQPVFMGGKIVAGNQLAKVGVEAAKLQAGIAQREQLEQVEQSYWLVYSLQRKQEIIDVANHLTDTAYQIVEAAVEAGLALRSDLMQVQMRRDEIERRQLQLTNGLTLAKRALALSIGLPENELPELAAPLLDDEQILPSDTLAQTDEHRLLELQIKAAELERRMALADALPQLAIGANYSYSNWQTNLLRNGLGNKTGNGALFVTLNVPLTGWWEIGHKLKEKQYAIEQARIDADYLGAQLNLRTRQAYDRMIEAAALLQLQQRMLEHAQEAYTQAQTNYEAGMSTITDLLQAQTTFTQAQVDLSDAQIACKVQSKRYKDLIAQ